MHTINILTQQQFQRVLFHSGCTAEDSNYVVIVGTLGGLLGLLLLIMVVAVVLGTCIWLCIRHKMQKLKATGKCVTSHVLHDSVHKDCTVFLGLHESYVVGMWLQLVCIALHMQILILM